MATVTAKINRVFLNRGADLFFMGENVAVPFGSCAAKARERDRAKFSKRLVGLGDGWAVGPWRNRVIDGYIFPDLMECEITRRQAQ